MLAQPLRTSLLLRLSLVLPRLFFLPPASLSQPSSFPLSISFAAFCFCLFCGEVRFCSRRLPRWRSSPLLPSVSLLSSFLSSSATFLFDVFLLPRSLRPFLAAVISLFAFSTRGLSRGARLQRTAVRRWFAVGSAFFFLPLLLLCLFRKGGEGGTQEKRRGGCGRECTARLRGKGKPQPARWVGRQRLGRKSAAAACSRSG